MMDKTLVTIIVPVYNREATIIRCLDSIAKQRGIERFELILVDNNSTDKSVETIKKWQTTHSNIKSILISERKQSAAAARNAGLDIVTTPYVMFFDSDDEMLQGHLERLLDGITQNPDADIIGWNTNCQLPDMHWYKASFNCKRPMYNHLIDSSLATQRFAVKTQFIKSAGGWDSTLPGWDDLELGVRLISLKPEMVKLSDHASCPLVKTYFTSNSITGSSFSVSPEKWEAALDKIEEAITKSFPDELYLVAFRRAALAGHYAREGAVRDGQRLLKKATANKFGKIKARAVYETARVFGRGIRLLASLLLS